MSSIRLLHNYWDEPADNLDSFKLSLVTRALKIGMRHSEHQRLPVDPSLLRKLCTLCDEEHSSAGRMLKCAVLFAFYGFLRQSNLAPRRASQFDYTRHTCRGDILISKENGISILVKWSKNRQTLSDKIVIPLPTISDSAVDPYIAYMDMVKDTPTTSANQPLLLLPSKGPARVVTIDDLRRGFAGLLAAAGLDVRLYSLHSLRRGGATTAYTAGANPRDVQLHGGWKSQAFWGYIAAPQEHSAVAGALQRAASATTRPHSAIGSAATSSQSRG